MRIVITLVLATLISGCANFVAPSSVAAASTSLTTEQAQALVFMREEEKLARDVYLALAERWQLALFENIAVAEQNHMDAIKILLDRYGIADPAAGKAEGQFSNPTLQNLYTQFVARGNTSLVEALAVGAAIEELDIRDLQTRTASTLPADIAQVFERLLEGSANHLRAFVRQWQAQTGTSYLPQYLDPTTYAGILDGATRPGNGNSGTGSANCNPTGSTCTGNGGNGHQNGGNGGNGNRGGRP